MPTPDQCVAWVDRFPALAQYLIPLLPQEPAHQHALAAWACAQILTPVLDREPDEHDPALARAADAREAIMTGDASLFRQAAPETAHAIITRLPLTRPDPGDKVYTMRWTPLLHLDVIGPGDRETLMGHWRAWGKPVLMATNLAKLVGLAPHHYAELLLSIPPDLRSGPAWAIADRTALAEDPAGRLALTLSLAPTDGPSSPIDVLRHLPREVLGMALQSPYAVDRTLAFAALCDPLPPEAPLDPSITPSGRRSR